MTGRRALGLVVTLAVMLMVGIVGMLLVDRDWDGVFLFMTAVPLILGMGCWLRERRRFRYGYRPGESGTDRHHP